MMLQLKSIRGCIIATQLKKCVQVLHFSIFLIAEGVKFTMSSDSHFPNDLGIFSDDIRKMLLDSGVDEVATFLKRQRIMEPLQEEYSYNLAK